MKEGIYNKISIGLVGKSVSNNFTRKQIYNNAEIKESVLNRQKSDIATPDEIGGGLVKSLF